MAIVKSVGKIMDNFDYDLLMKDKLQKLKIKVNLN
jgi:hypothetical protein